MSWSARCRGAVSCVLAGLVLLVATETDAAVTVALEGGTTVRVAGATAGEAVALLSVSRVPQEWSAVVIPDCQSLADEDADGELTLEPPSGVPEQSVWIAVDRVTGELAASWPDEGEVAEVELDLATALIAGATGQLTVLQTPLKDVELAVVRPGGGLWHFAGSDGGATDFGVADDELVTAELSLATPIGDSQTFDGLAAGDVIVGIGPKTLEFFAVQVAEEEE